MLWNELFLGIDGIGVEEEAGLFSWSGSMEASYTPLVLARTVTLKLTAEGPDGVLSQTMLVWTEILTELLSLKKSKGDLCICI